MHESVGSAAGPAARETDYALTHHADDSRRCRKSPNRSNLDQTRSGRYLPGNVGAGDIMVSPEWSRYAVDNNVRRIMDHEGRLVRAGRL